MLRHILTAFTAFSIAAGAYAATPAAADTIMHASGVDVVIAESPGGITISAGDIEHFEPYSDSVSIRSARVPYRTASYSAWTRGRVTWDIISGNIMFGFTGAPGAPAALDIEQGKSFEISWMNIVAAQCYFKDVRTAISAGVGITWRNYRTTTGMQFIGRDDATTGYAPFAPDVTPKYSRLKVFSLSFPILFKHYFKVPRMPYLAIHAGPVLNWNSHASLQSRWIDADGHKQKYSTNRVGQRRFSVDLYAAVRLFSTFGLYVRYSPQSVLRGNPDLDFTTFSTGFALGL